MVFSLLQSLREEEKMGEVCPSAELVYRQYDKDKKTKFLIDWFKAELALRDEYAQKIHGQHKDAFLEKHQDHVEKLAGLWRDQRLAVSMSAVV